MKFCEEALSAGDSSLLTVARLLGRMCHELKGKTVCVCVCVFCVCVRVCVCVCVKFAGGKRGMLWVTKFKHKFITGELSI